MPEFTHLAAVEVSAKGNGFDYYLSRVDDDSRIFNHTAALEVSGIHQENEANTVERRIAAKRRRLERVTRSTTTAGDLPTYICVVAFGWPSITVVIA